MVNTALILDKFVLFSLSQFVHIRHDFESYYIEFLSLSSSSLNSIILLGPKLTIPQILFDLTHVVVGV